MICNCFLWILNRLIYEKKTFFERNEAYLGVCKQFKTFTLKNYLFKFLRTPIFKNTNFGARTRLRPQNSSAHVIFTFLFPVLFSQLKWNDFFCIHLDILTLTCISEIPFIENFLFFEIRANPSWLWSLLRFIYFHSNAQYKLCYLYNIDCSNIFSDNWVTINLTHSLVHFELEVSFRFS